MKIITVLIIFFSFFLLYGNQFQILQEPVEVSMHAGFVNLPNKDRYDINGDLCGMLIVRTGIEEMNIDSPMRHRQINKAGEYWVVLSPGTSYVDLKKVDYATLMVDFRQSINKIEAGKVYEMTIDGDGGEFLPVSIIAEPAGAEKWLDGELLGTADTYAIKKGEHLLEVKKSRYKNYSSSITVNEEQVLFRDIILEEQRPVMLTITSEPQDADLYLDNVKEGVTNIQPFRFPGVYNLKLVMDKYETVEKKINVIEEGENTWHYDLVKITSILSISTTPPDADIQVNSQKLNVTSKEVAAGQYLIEVSKEGWYSKNQTVEVEKGKNKSVVFILEQMTGNLQVTVSPMEANSILKSNINKNITWTGSKYMIDLPVGDYELTTSLSGYGVQTNKVKVKVKETASLNVALGKAPENVKPQTVTSFLVEMVKVSGGTFQMGSNDGGIIEQPVPSVTVSDFYIGKYEVTQEQYEKVMGKNPSYFKNAGKTAPVESVSWYDAVEFCNKLSEKEDLQTCYSGSGVNIKCDFSVNGYRLPSVAEWEFAARGGNQSKGYEYSGSNNIDEVAEHYYNNDKSTKSVGGRKPNELGIYDMSGNVWEWCWDTYSSSYYQSHGKPSYAGPSLNSQRVYRGGSWKTVPGGCRSWVIFSNLYFNCESRLGFRLARSSK